MNKIEAIRQFLRSSGNPHLTNLYNGEMEVQVNVAQDNGQRYSGIYAGKGWSGWHDPETGERWKSFRIPWNADSLPSYDDSEMTFDLAKHVEGIGLTGWNWMEQKSLWVGFDFDSIANHKAGLSDTELNEVKQKVLTLPYVTLIKSTSGKGLHVYIFLAEPVKTENHTEHAALARSILSMMSGEIGFNFDNSVDICGGVLWIYHRKQEGTDGLSLLRQGDNLPISKIPANWREHTIVTSGRKKKIKTKGIGDEFDDLFSTIKFTPLDEEHLKLINWLKTKATKDNWWDSDHNMLVCHTFDLKAAHVELKMKGIFETNSSGSSSQNCFAFPIPGGAWVIRRHGLGVKEHASWLNDASGWTKCIYNALPDLEACAKSNSGVESASGEYVFDSAKDGIQTLTNLGLQLELPEKMLYRDMKVKEKSNKLIISIQREEKDAKLDGFLPNKKGDRWEKVLRYNRPKRETESYDKLIRHCISNGAEAGWFIYINEEWVAHPKSNVSTVLLSQNGVYGSQDIEILLSKAILNPWRLVNIPFADEYPGNRQWNKDAACIAVMPEEGPCDTWISLLEHCGKGLTDVVLTENWCIDNAIKTGGEYLLCWFASMFQRPSEPLPYLFFVGEQNTGKSTLHEAVGRFLISKGYTRADNALTSSSGFNQEIANAVLCVVEETDLRSNKEAGNRIKDWVTGRTISIRALYKNAIDCLNTTHWIQCANDNHCPILPGDTRIVYCRVDKPEKEIPKNILFERLDREKAAFLKVLLNLELPKAPGRLAIPCLTTHEKKEAEMSHMSDLEEFIAVETEQCDGNLITFNDFCSIFNIWLPSDKKLFWTNQRVSKQMPKTVIKGKHGSDNVTYVANIKFKNQKIDQLPNGEKYRFNTANGRIELCKQ